MKAAKRKKLKKSDFAYPAQRRYPIDTPKRARNALSRAAQSGTSGSYQHVAKKVRARYGDAIVATGPTKGSVTHAGTRKKH